MDGDWLWMMGAISKGYKTTFESTTSLCDFYPSQNHQISQKIAKFFWKNYQIWAIFFFWKIRQKITNSKTVLFPKIPPAHFRRQIFAENSEKMHVSNKNDNTQSQKHKFSLKSPKKCMCMNCGSTFFRRNLPKNACIQHRTDCTNLGKDNFSLKSPKKCTALKYSMDSMELMGVQYFAEISQILLWLSSVRLLVHNFGGFRRKFDISGSCTCNMHTFLREMHVLSTPISSKFWGISAKICTPGL